MKNTVLLAIMAGWIMSCGVYYNKTIYLPSRHDKGWVLGHDYSSFDCSNGAIVTSGIIANENKYEAMLGVPVPIEYGDKVPKLWLSSKRGAIKSGKCELDFVQLTNDGRTMKPVSVNELVVKSGDSAGLYCTYEFNNEVLSYNSVTLVFNSEVAACSIPMLLLVRGHDKGYRNVQFQ